MAPSVSFAPSSSPTYVGSEVALFTTTFPLTSLLTTAEQDGFQYGTEEWILQVPDYGSHYSDPQVTLVNQTLINTFNTTSGARALQATQKNGTVALQLNFQVTVDFTGPETALSLFQVLNPLIQEPAELWIHLLGNYNEVFLQLRTGTNTTQMSSANATSLSIIGLIAIVVVAGTAIALAVSASIFSVRSHKLSVYGEELHSPKRISQPQLQVQSTHEGSGSQSSEEEETTLFDTTTQIMEEALPPAAHEQQPMVDYEEEQYQVQQLPFQYQQQQQETKVHEQQTAPTYIDQYRSDIAINNLGAYQYQNNYNSHYHTRSRSNQDPPSSRSEVADFEDYRNKGALFDRVSNDGRQL